MNKKYEPQYLRDGYEPVADRIKRFWKDNPGGAIHTELMSPQEKIMDFVLFKAKVYRQEVLSGIGHALEEVDKEVKMSKTNKEYYDVNATSWIENCETSAVGRALQMAGYGSDKCSKEEIEAAERKKRKLEQVKAKKEAQQVRVEELKANPSSNLSEAIKEILETMEGMNYKTVSEAKSLSPSDVKDIIVKKNLNDDEKALVWSEMIDWIEANLPEVDKYTGEIIEGH